MSTSRIGVVGAGYVGLTTAACMASLGHNVVCGDVDVVKLARLSRGDVPILEPGLPELVQQGIQSGRLSFVLGAAAAAEGNDFVFLCVPTPPAPDASADLSLVEQVVGEIGLALKADAVVVAKSTMPPGSGRKIERLLHDVAGPHGITVASNPEFLREGSAVHDFLHPVRIVIGADEPGVAERLTALYQSIDAPVVMTDCPSAEMIKYASNAFLATKLSFINQIAHVCEALGADVLEVAYGMGHDPRIGFDFLRPGPGYGGSCLPKDTAALIRVAHHAGFDFSLLRQVDQVNRAQHEHVVGKIGAAAGRLDGSRVAVWGLTFKADTDDLRASPALTIVERLLQEGAEVVGYDPVADRELAHALVTRRGVLLPATTSGRPEAGISSPAASTWADARFASADDPYEACQGASVLAVLTEWTQFRALDFERVKVAMAAPVIVDARNLLDRDALRQLGFEYWGLGR
ncbi:MAG: UDP-glucose/GDP-mannose dehydrogenase family protein [Actinobacteria bacterium]|nr:UDP-glucose/GDP-mannose dehydrogenase family protein [Actinomycetota bacterium]